MKLNSGGYFLAALLANAWAVGNEVRYNVVALESERAPWVALTMATDISDTGWVTGYIYPGPNSPSGGYVTMFSYHPDSGFVDLGNLPDTATQGYGINDHGQISGTARAADRDIAFRYTPGVGFELLGDLGGQEGAAADDINLRGQVIGNAQCADGSTHAFRYTDGVGIEDLGTMAGNYSIATGLNDSGWVAGSALAADGGSHAFLYRDGDGMIDLGAGMGTAMNNTGVVAGRSYDGAPLIFREGSPPVPVPGPSGLYYVSDINDYNVLVGGITFDDGILRAYLATESGGVVLLNDLIPPDSGWTLHHATAINNTGQIVGEGYWNGGSWAFRLDPIPEPSVWALLALGGLLWLGRRCSRKSSTPR